MTDLERNQMMQGARTILEDCLSLKKGEKFLIVTDPALKTIAQVLVDAAYDRGINAILEIMDPRERDGQEPPLSTAEAMKKSDVIVCPVSISITHTNAVKEAAAMGARILVMTAFTKELMMHGGIEADFKAQKPICEKLAQLFSEAESIHLTNPAGTNLRMEVVGQRGNALTCIVEPGQFSTIPTIEANVSPIVGSSEGVIVADASIPYLGIGLLKEPIHFRVTKGFITDIRGGYQAKLLMNDLEAKNDPNVYNIAELGVGLNPKCKMTGIMLDDEGVLGSAHIGIGSNFTLGGNLKAAIHYDLVLWHPTIKLDKKIVMKNGNIEFSL